MPCSNQTCTVHIFLPFRNRYIYVLSVYYFNDSTRPPMTSSTTCDIMPGPSSWRHVTGILFDYFVGKLQVNSQIVYGIKVLPTEDPYITTAENALAGVTAAANPGAFLVDTLPICTSAHPCYSPFPPSSFLSPFWLLGKASCNL